MDNNLEATKARLRERMVESQIRARGVRDRRVLEAMLKLDRQFFAGEHSVEDAYGDFPLGIGYGQTISQPYIVALMTELCILGGEERVLEIGTGSAYQTAILALLAKEVYSLEIVQAHSEAAQKKLDILGFNNVHLRHGDGYEGWEEAAPFDCILLTASPPTLPEKLIGQLKDGGVFVAPVGTHSQRLLRIKKEGSSLKEEEITFVRFVPMVKK